MKPRKNIEIPLTAGLEIVVFLPSIWMQTFAAISRSLTKLKEDILFSLIALAIIGNFIYRCFDERAKLNLLRIDIFPYLLLRGLTLTATLTEAMFSHVISFL